MMCLGGRDCSEESEATFIIVGLVTRASLGSTLSESHRSYLNSK